MALTLALPVHNRDSQISLQDRRTPYMWLREMISLLVFSPLVAVARRGGESCDCICLVDV